MSLTFYYLSFLLDLFLLSFRCSGVSSEVLGLPLFSCFYSYVIKFSKMQFTFASLYQARVTNGMPLFCD